MLRTLERALELLQASTQADEDDLNRELYFCLLRANHEAHNREGDALPCPPCYEGRNLPSGRHRSRAPREHKRPDFYWSILDHTAVKPEFAVLSYYIECKRLGDSGSPAWRLNENYVNHGIMRFVSESHGYAVDETSAAMIGYVVNSEPRQILSEVNAAARALMLPPLVGPGGGWKASGTSHLVHDLTRMCGPSPFRLQHFWRDLREDGPRRQRRAKKLKGAPAAGGKRRR